MLSTTLPEQDAFITMSARKDTQDKREFMFTPLDFRSPRRSPDFHTDRQPDARLVFLQVDGRSASSGVYSGHWEAARESEITP